MNTLVCRLARRPIWNNSLKKHAFILHLKLYSLLHLWKYIKVPLKLNASFQGSYKIAKLLFHNSLLFFISEVFLFFLPAKDFETSKVSSWSGRSVLFQKIESYQSKL